MVAYVSMAPVGCILKREFAQRRKAFLTHRSTNHWAAQGFRFNAVRFYTSEKEALFRERMAGVVERLPKRRLTELGETVAGLKDPPYAMVNERRKRRKLEQDKFC